MEKVCWDEEADQGDCDLSRLEAREPPKLEQIAAAVRGTRTGIDQEPSWFAFGSGPAHGWAHSHVDALVDVGISKG